MKNQPRTPIKKLKEKEAPNDKDFEAALSYANCENDPRTKAAMMFNIADACSKARRHELAEETYKLANSLIWETIDYNDDAVDDLVQELISEFSDSWLSNVQVDAMPTQKSPIFIVGMPRSGTTLLEQIFDSHSKVHGVGESSALPKMRMLSQKITKKKFPFSITKSAPELVLNETAAYYEKLVLDESRFPEKYFVDKMPHNFLCAGWIYSAFPRAKIIALRRDPKAIALSNYFQNFKAENGLLGYSFNMKSIGRHIRSFEKLMFHWNTVLGSDKYMEIWYEDLVSNPMSSMQKVLKFCNLPYENDIFDFYKRKSTVRTASIKQVRNPINTSSIKKYEHYANLMSEFEEGYQHADN